MYIHTQKKVTHAEMQRTCVRVVQSLMAKGTLRMFARVRARSVLPLPVGPAKRMLLFSN